jgi:hypothetical protein
MYERQQLRTFTDFTPLNHLDDAVPPESDTAREFNEIAKRIVSGKDLFRLPARATLPNALALRRAGHASG